MSEIGSRFNSTNAVAEYKGKSSDVFDCGRLYPIQINTNIFRHIIVHQTRGYYHKRSGMSEKYKTFEEFINSWRITKIVKD